MTRDGDPSGDELPDRVRLSAAGLSREMAGLLAQDDAQRMQRYPGPGALWQPVHTVYVPADAFNCDTVTDWGRAALASLDACGPLPGLADHEPAVRAKLSAEPIEDLRIDFEDGYGRRADREEDRAVIDSSRALAALVAADQLPRAWGIRLKCLEPELRDRAIRTLGLFLSQMCTGDGGLTDGRLPAGFRITMPKVTSIAQVEAMVRLCAAMEADYGLSAGTLRFEIQVETPQAILGANGVALIAPMLHAADGRCVGLHYGTYDYSASVGIAAGFQSLEHPAADYAKAVMQVAAAGTGVPVCDGSSNVLPVGDRASVQSAWQLHARLVRRSLERGFYQGWDMHPAQLPTRYAANFGFYADGMPTAVRRLAAYLSRAAGGVLDEPATARALAAFLLRGIDCGAVSMPQLATELDAGPTPVVIDRVVLERLALTGS